MCSLWIDNLVVASFCTSDTTTDLILTTFSCFITPLWISQLCTSNRDHVDLAVFDQLVSKCWHVNTSNTDYRDVNCFLDLSDVFHIETWFKVIWRYFVYCCKASCITS